MTTQEVFFSSDKKKLSGRLLRAMHQPLTYLCCRKMNTNVFLKQKL